MVGLRCTECEGPTCEETHDENQLCEDCQASQEEDSYYNA